MELQGPGGDAFCMQIVGYQFPELADRDYDSNWLLIDISATVRGKSWRSCHPSLLTWEVDELAQWMESIACGKEPGLELHFIEPNLSFRLRERTDDLIGLGVVFDQESRPKADRSGAGAEDEIQAELECTPLELKVWAETLREALGRFPFRVGEENPK